VYNETPSVVAMRVNDPDRSRLESIAETQPQLQPALSEIVGDYFPVFQRHRSLLIIQDGFPCRFVHFKLSAQFLEACGENSLAHIADRTV